MLHFPETVADTELARRRLALDEFIALQRQIQLRRKNFETKAQALPCRGDNRLIKPFLARLGFKLTAAQTKVLRELRQDLSGAHPMRRLLQGDVGSGKTVVAACCALMALESGYHVALMAPTEVLAEQHFGNFTRWLEPLGVAVELQTGSRKTAEVQSRRQKSKVQAPASSLQPTPTLTIGTHALIEAGFAPDNLGLVIIDEQHKFGVAQREQLVRKGRYPHLLVMTATPIPRTLGLTLYGDLDVSVIDELPPGRGRIQDLRARGGQAAASLGVHPRQAGRGPAGLCGLSARRGRRPRRRQGRHEGIREPAADAGAVPRRAAARAAALQGEGGGHGRLSRRPGPGAAGDLADRGGRGCAQRHDHADRERRACSAWPSSINCAAASAGARTIPTASWWPPRRARRRARACGCWRRPPTASASPRRTCSLRGPGELLGQQQSGMPRFRFGDLATDLDLIQQARHLAAQLPDEATNAR